MTIILLLICRALSESKYYFFNRSDFSLQSALKEKSFYVNYYENFSIDLSNCDIKSYSINFENYDKS